MKMKFTKLSWLFLDEILQLQQTNWTFSPFLHFSHGKSHHSQSSSEYPSWTWEKLWRPDRYLFWSNQVLWFFHDLRQFSKVCWLFLHWKKENSFFFQVMLHLQESSKLNCTFPRVNDQWFMCANEWVKIPKWMKYVMIAVM